MGGSNGGEGDVPLSVVADSTQSPPVLRVGGELDVATAPLLEDSAAALPGQPAAVVLDLTELSFLDSSGLTGIIRVHRRLAAHGGHVIVRGARPFVREILRVSGLDRVLTVES